MNRPSVPYTESLKELLALDECSELSVASLCASLSETARAWATDALEGRDVSGRPVPTQAPEPKPRAPKRKETAKGESKKAAKKAKADAEEDGELCD